MPTAEDPAYAPGVDPVCLQQLRSSSSSNTEITQGPRRTDSIDSLSRVTESATHSIHARHDACTRSHLKRTADSTAAVGTTAK